MPEKEKTKYLIGTSGWSYNDWRGIFYPKNVARSDWLHFYSKHFPVVEMNATFYRLFKKEHYLRWYHSVPSAFRFIVKVPKLITHEKYLIDCENEIKVFCESTTPLKNKLALFLLQLAPRTAYDPLRLENALLAFPDRKKVVVEFRNEKWFTPEIRTLLINMGVSFCASDSPVTELQDWLTTKIAYIRLHGHKFWYDYDYSKKELDVVKNFARCLAKKGAKKIFILFNNDYKAYSIQNAVYLQKYLKK